MYNHAWSREHALILIKELRKYKCLYDPLDENFIDKRVRLQKLNIIRDKLKSIRPNVTVSEIKRKIKSLKSQLWKEKKKLKIFKNSSDADEIYFEPKLWCYNELSFLLSTKDEEPSQSNIDCLEEVEMPNNEESKYISDTQELKHNLEDSGSGVTPEKLFDTEEFRSNSDTQELNHNLEDSGSGVTPEKKVKVEVTQLEKSGMEAIEFMKQYLENRQVKQSLEKEEQFCQYLCSLLKRIKSEERFEDISLQIITLVNQTINEERKQPQATLTSDDLEIYPLENHHPAIL